MLQMAPGLRALFRNNLNLYDGRHPPHNDGKFSTDTSYDDRVVAKQYQNNHYPDKTMAHKKHTETSSRFYSGTSNLVLPIPKYLFPEPYQKASRLTYYASLCNSVEINSTFYKLPLQKTVANWLLQVPGHFRFTFKLWKEITHAKALDFKEADIERFFRVIRDVRRGCVLIQFPPGIGLSHSRQLRALLAHVASYNTQQLDIAVEFRNRSWYTADTYRLLDEHKACMVRHDMPKSVTPMTSLGTDNMYLRFHGPTGNYRGSYAAPVLADYASLICEWLKEGKTVYAYFNNTMGEAFENLKTLNQYVLQGL